MMEVPPAYAINRGSAAIVGSASFLFQYRQSKNKSISNSSCTSLVKWTEKLSDMQHTLSMEYQEHRQQIQEES